MLINLSVSGATGCSTVWGSDMTSSTFPNRKKIKTNNTFLFQITLPSWTLCLPAFCFRTILFALWERKNW